MVPARQPLPHNLDGSSQCGQTILPTHLDDMFDNSKGSRPL
ncbi:hypothetical protein HMPREF9587_00875 [Cutibacterium acnes HL025PA1]|nr:hypothetical protein HMPREF9587_00875 [Cutibacterium acnes HL025PA1]